MVIGIVAVIFAMGVDAFSRLRTQKEGLKWMF